MSRIYDNWERLVDATLLREHLRYLSRIDSATTSESFDSFHQNRSLSEYSLDYVKLGYAFTYKQILKATSNFRAKNLIKRGRSGDFFRGDFSASSLLFSRSNRIVAPASSLIVIKRIDLKLAKNREAYLSELDFLSKVWQARYFSFLGYCLEKQNQKFLVYKYTCNGDLTSSLFKKNTSHGELKSLDWITRMKIAIGAAEALAYLHEECTPPLVHGDVQASSILLDDNFEVRLGSLHQSGAQDIHSHAHDDWISREPEEGNLGNPEVLTSSYDVYCFGKVLLELVTGKLGISSPNNAISKEWLEQVPRYISINDKELAIKIVDPSLIVDDDLLEEVLAMAIVSKACLDPNPKSRPVTRHIVKALENPLELIRADSSSESWTAALLGSS
ncbi:hypothetical protein BUALT_Bualt15G0024200 [Buddleja alternifolia]|uniref:Protein kinase domain-containing protein n=1 Tax=Buddleja alternifolia TaxID=168488 RepID=A0AAV6WJS2_9LAMI|nr:hypothetical protein BUALT_Bualt15G0024200 [Buddleja alternifolia]